MAEEINKNQTELNDEQLDDVSGGSTQRGTGTSGLGGIAIRHAFD